MNLNEKVNAGEMKIYTGTKTIKAVLTTKAEYLEYRGWNLPDGENPNEEVYLVEYPAEEDTIPNHKNHKGYISMSPKTVLEKYYKTHETDVDRLRIEGNDLSEKITKLKKAFDNETFPKGEKDILSLQLSAMTTYMNVLIIRLNKIGETKSN